MKLPLKSEDVEPLRPVERCSKKNCFYCNPKPLPVLLENVEPISKLRKRMKKKGER